MPAYNFQRRFVFPILLGKKPHTIRRRRKYATEPGDRIMMYTGLRTKKACKFGEAPCIKIEPIILYLRKHEVLVADERGVYAWMKDYVVEALARHDGFSNVESFFYFFEHTYRDEMLDDFEIIWWDPLRVEVMPGVKMFSAVRMFAVRGTYRPLDRDAFNRAYFNPWSAWSDQRMAKLEAIAEWEERRRR